MRLLDLRPKIYRHTIQPASEGQGRPQPDSSVQWGGFPVSVFIPVRYLHEADRIMFYCPKCFSGNGHQIAVDFVGRGTPDEACVRNDQGLPVRWSVAGATALDISLTPSILLLSDCKWHGFITNGEVIGA